MITVKGATLSQTTSTITFSGYTNQAALLETGSCTLSLATQFQKLSAVNLYSIGNVLRNSNSGNLAIAGQKAMYSFRFMTTNSLPTTEQLNIYDTANVLTWNNAATATWRLKCNLQTVAAPFATATAALSCKINPGRKCIEMVFSGSPMNFQSDLYQVNIFRLDVDQPLFDMPATPQLLRFMINDEVASTYVIKQTGVVFANIYAAKLVQGCIRSFISGTGDNNTLSIKFNAPTGGIAASDFIDVEFPLLHKTSTSTSATYYLKDVGTMVQNGWFVGVQDKNGALGAAFKARVFYAPGPRTGLPATIRITG